jgi:predicted RNA methylase
VDLFAQLVAHYDQLKYALLEAQTFDPAHYGFPPLYYDIMESDQLRIGAFQRAFAQYDFRDKIVCEAGVGHLALSQYYLPYVRKAYLIENNRVLRQYIEKYLYKRGWVNKVELIFGDARTAVLPEAVDCLIAEMMSIWAINEHQVPVFQHLRSFLKPGGQLFPERIINIVQLASADFEEGHQHYPINFSRHLPEELSLPVVAHSINLYEDQAARHSFTCQLIPHLSGRVNALCLRSAVQLCEGYNFTGTDSLMPPTVYRLAQEHIVKAGQRLTLKGTFTYGTSLEEARFELF